MNALEELGLSEVETRIYLALLDRASATPEKLRPLTDDEATVDASLENLQEFGLITRLAGTPTQYVAVRPELGVGVLLRQHEERLVQVRSALTALSDRFHAAPRDSRRPDEVIELLESPEAIHQRWLHLQRSARREIRALDKPPYIDSGNPAEPDLLVRGLTYRTVYDRATLDLPGKLAGIWEAVEAGEDCRVTDDVPIKLFIADDQMALAPLGTGPDLVTAVVVHRSGLLDALSALFEAVWQRALPIAAFEPGQHPDATALTEHQRRLLQLLASGCTDETTARYMKLGPRTVQRQIRALMDTFGVRTRFQLGLRAAAFLEANQSEVQSE